MKMDEVPIAVIPSVRESPRMKTIANWFLITEAIAVGVAQEF